MPMILGLVPAFRYCNSKAAIASVIAGLSMFVVTKIVDVPLSLAVGSPVVTSLIVFIGLGILSRNQPIKPEVAELLNTKSVKHSDSYSKSL